MIPKITSDINFWASQQYLRDQAISARVDVENGDWALLISLLSNDRFSWHPETAAYKRGNRNVSPLRVKTELQRYLASRKKIVSSAANNYIFGRSSIEQYTVSMRDNILNSHITALALGSGGWGNLGESEYDSLHDFLTKGDKEKDKKGELAYLLLLLGGLESRTIIYDRRVAIRSRQYIAAANVTYEVERQQQVIDNTPPGLGTSASVELQQAQWDAQRLEEEARKAEAAARRAREKANKPDATAEDKAAADEAEKRAVDARRRADDAQSVADEKLNVAIDNAKPGAAWELNVRHARDSCLGCIHETDRGKVPVGALIPVGYRTCRGNCLCTIEYGIY